MLKKTMKLNYLYYFYLKYQIFFKKLIKYLLYYNYTFFINILLYVYTYIIKFFNMVKKTDTKVLKMYNIQVH